MTDVAQPPADGLGSWVKPERPQNRHLKPGGTHLRQLHFVPERYPDLQCTAKSRRTGERCRRCVVRGKTVCEFHGGRNRKKGQTPLLGKTPRAERNRLVKLGMTVARQEAETVPQEVLKEFARNWADRVPSRDRDRFLVMLHRRMLGELSSAAWRDAQRVAGLLQDP